MAESDGELQEGHGIPRRVLWSLGALAILVLGVVLSRGVFARSSGEPRIDVQNLAEVLRYGNLPQAFSYGGMTWEAVEPGRFGKRVPLTQVGATLGGLSIWYPAGMPTTPYRTLYLPAAQTGPYSDLYVRYNPGG